MTGPDRRTFAEAGRVTRDSGRTTVPRLLVAVVVVLAVVGGGATFIASQTDRDERPAAETPGEHLAGSVSAQTAEFEGELEQRTLSARVDAAEGNASRGALIAAEVAAVESRLESVATAFEAATEGRESGTLGESAYRTRVTRLVAESELLEARASYLATLASELPPSVQEEYGITPATMRTLADRAEALATTEQRSAARALAGDDVGTRLSDDEEDDGDDVDEADDGDVEDVDETEDNEDASVEAERTDDAGDHETDASETTSGTEEPTDDERTERTDGTDDADDADDENADDADDENADDEDDTDDEDDAD